MLTRTITYTDFNDNTVTDVFHFNLTETEVLELESSFEGGMEQRLRNIVEQKDNKLIVKEFQKLILLAYGQKSEDGKKFLKSQALRDEFEQHAAYNQLFMELAMDAEAAATFMNAILPSKIREQIPATPAPPSTLPAPGANG